VAGFVGLAIILALGKHVWVLIPAALGLQGTLNFLPGSPPPWALAAAVTATMFAIRFAMRKPDFVWRFDLLDCAVLLQVVVIAQAYARNPTGLMLLGGDTAGGKPYFIFASAVVAYFCIALAKPEVRSIRWALVLMIGIFAMDGIIATAGDFSPAFSSLVLPIYSNVNLGVAVAGAVERDLSVVRGGYGFAQLGKAMVLPCLCLTRPLNCLNPFRPLLFVLVVSGSILVLLSGFRSGIAYLAVAFVVSALIRRKVVDIVGVSFIAFFALAILLLSGQVRDLPYGVQRVISLLPVEVDSAARVDAEQSAEWRFEMWRLALGTDRYIQNKWLGDGFALSSREMHAIIDTIQGYTSFMDSSQEQALAKGSYHGFHVETIRFTGVVGLLAALFLMAAAFRTASTCIRRLRDDTLFPYVVFVALPVFIYPFWAILVFGSYRSEFPQFIALAGILKMLDNLSHAGQTVPQIDAATSRTEYGGQKNPSFAN
jgi:uncharacterized membrane protein YhaH (DUF805 family)